MSEKKKKRGFLYYLAKIFGINDTKKKEYKERRYGRITGRGMGRFFR